MDAGGIAGDRLLSTALVRYDAMCRAIAEAHRVDEVKEIRDKALAIEVYSRQARNIENEKKAIEIRIRAERRCGELLHDREQPKGNQYGGSSHATLQDLGITKNQSSRWQKLAAVPAEDFEATFAGSAKPSTGAILGHQSSPAKKSNAVGDKALWLWGRLLDFERDGLLDANPNDVCSTMLDHMKDTIRELAPRVAQWLGEIDI